MPDIQWLIDLVRAMGIAGGPVFAVLFWLERIDRKAAEKDVRALLPQVLTAITQTADSIREVTKAVAAGGADTKDINATLAQLVQLVHILSITINGSRRKRGS